jgi:hypothetical protein
VNERDPLEGRYQSPGEPFTLRAVEGGYRREFEPGRWTWDEARTWTRGEVEARAGEWRKK